MGHFIFLFFGFFLLGPISVSAQIKTGDIQSQDAYMNEDEINARLSFSQHFLDLEEYVGISQDQLVDRLGEPMTTSVESKGIEEREALLWYYEIGVTNESVVRWRVALQNARVVGIQVVTGDDPYILYSDAVNFLIEGKSTVGRAAGSQYRKVARRKDLIWQVDFTNQESGDRAVLEIGTVKYSTCPLVWAVEGLRGTDGFGNPIH